MTLLERRGGGVRRRTNSYQSKHTSRCLMGPHYLSLNPRAVQIHGSNWLAVADSVQRSSADCSDRYRQHVRYKDTRRKGMSLTVLLTFSSMTLRSFKGLGLRRRRANFYMQLRRWLGRVKLTRLLVDIGYPCRRHWVRPGHQSSVRVNGAFLF